MARREITVYLDEDVSPEEYAKPANVVWSVASMSPAFTGVQQDSGADRQYLNNGHDKEDGQNRWS